MSSKGLSGAWQRVQLGDVATVHVGLAKNANVHTDGVERPYLRVANVQAGWLDLTTVKSVSVDIDAVHRYELRRGDVLMTEGGDFDKLGRGTVWRGEIPGCLHQNHVFAVRPNPDYLLPEFLAAWSASSVARKYFKASSKRTTNLASINSGQLKAAALCLPPVAAQRAIVRLLATFETRSKQLNALVDARRALKHGLMQRLLAPLGSTPRSSTVWQTHRLGDLFRPRTEVSRADLRLLAVTGGRGVVPRHDLDRKDSSNPDKSRYLRVAPGDIVYNTMRMWQGVSARSSLEGIVSPAYTVCVPGREIDAEFAAVLFKHTPVVHLFHRHSQGLVSDTLNLKFDSFAKILFAYRISRLSGPSRRSSEPSIRK